MSLYHRNSRIFGVILSLFLLSGCFHDDTLGHSACALEQLRQLEGTWDAQETAVLEEWTVEADGNIQVIVSNQGAETSYVSNMLFFTAVGDSLILSNRSQGQDQGAKRFSLDSCEDGLLIFDNLNPGFPHHIAYQIINSDELHVLAWAERDDIKKEFLVIYRRL